MGQHHKIRMMELQLLFALKSYEYFFSFIYKNELLICLQIISKINKQNMVYEIVND